MPKGGKEVTIAATLKRSFKIWPFVKTFTFTKNMRVLSAGKDDQEFARYLLRIGDGTEPVKESPDMVEIPAKMKSSANTLKDFCMEIFPGLKEKVRIGLEKIDVLGDGWVDWLMERAIICPKNDYVDKINQVCINEMPGEEVEYRSADRNLNESDEVRFPTEFLNKQTPSGTPPHKLVLKIGTPIMLLRNIDPKEVSTYNFILLNE